MTLFEFGAVLFVLLACNADNALTLAAATSPSPSPSSASPAPTEVANLEEITIAGADPQLWTIPPVKTSKATCGRLNVPLPTTTTTLTGNYALVKVTPTTNTFPTPVGLNTCSPFNFIQGTCGATRVFIDDSIPNSLSFSTVASNTKARTAHFVQEVSQLSVDFPLYRAQVTSMEQKSASGIFYSIVPIPAQVQLTQEVPFAMISSDDDRAWIAFVTCDVNNPLAWVLIKEELIGSQQQFDPYQNAFNQALKFSGVNVANMIDIPITDYNVPTSVVSNERLNLNSAAFVMTSATTATTTTTSPSPSPPQ